MESNPYIQTVHVYDIHMYVHMLDSGSDFELIAFWVFFGDVLKLPLHAGGGEAKRRCRGY